MWTASPKPPWVTPQCKAKHAPATEIPSSSHPDNNVGLATLTQPTCQKTSLLLNQHWILQDLLLYYCHTAVHCMPELNSWLKQAAMDRTLLTQTALTAGWPARVKNPHHGFSSTI